MRRTVLAPLFTIQETAENWGTALGSYDATIASRDSALLRALDAPALEAENERLRNLLMLAARLRWGFVPARVLHSGMPGRPTSLTISEGSNAGIRILSPVVNEDGLVGVVRSVDARTSVVSLWTDPEFAVGAMSEDRKAFGIITPHPGGGGEAYLLELRDVEIRHTLRNGTRIVAAGVGGVYPEMIPVGTIIDQLQEGTAWARSYLVRPAVTPQDISLVIVLDPDRAAEGIAGVWPSAAARDSMQRAIAARGDSIARVARQAELKAQADSALARLRASGMGNDTSVKPRSPTMPPVR
jgi:rod shape-determining protein MreC